MADSRVVSGGTELRCLAPGQSASRGRGGGEEPRPVQHAAVRTRETSRDLMPSSPACRPSTRHADLGEGFFDVVARAGSRSTSSATATSAGPTRVGLGGLDDAEWVRPLRPLRAAAGQLRRSRSRCAITATSSACTTPTSATAAASSSRSSTTGDGRLLDLGTKGSGRTPWSRGGDGRLTLKGGVREVLATEMLEALGVETSKTFSLIETGEALARGDEPSPTRSSVLVRLSHSHIRIGTLPAPRLPARRSGCAGCSTTRSRTYMPSSARGRGGAARSRSWSEVCASVAPHWARSGWRRASSTAC